MSNPTGPARHHHRADGASPDSPTNPRPGDTLAGSTMASSSTGPDRMSADDAPAEEASVDGLFAKVRCGWQIAELIATAMANDPVMGWATAGIEHPVERRRAVINFYRLLTAHTQQHGILRAHDDPTTRQPVAAALWLPPGANRRDLYTRIVRTSQQFGHRWRHLDEALDNARPADHHHLTALAVHPGAQGHGFGRVVLELVSE